MDHLKYDGKIGIFFTTKGTKKHKSFFNKKRFKSVIDLNLLVFILI